ncbi:hypothetical protein CVS40_4673 [Lucilia cuprina]|nr:hypothetical protein CVS40_4673 [Lucilia cuprina]
MFFRKLCKEFIYIIERDPTKTRCDAYYKCTELTADKHVGAYAMRKGLVYEHSLACLMGDHKTNTNLRPKNEKRQTNPTSNKDADIYIIIIGPGISDDDLYDGSGNGGELVELRWFYAGTNRENRTTSSNIDPKLTAHLQKIISKAKHKNEQDLRPDQLNAFWLILYKNKFDTLDPNEGVKDVSGSSTTNPKPNRTFLYKQEFNYYEVAIVTIIGNSGGGYSNSQNCKLIDPEGSDTLKYSSDNTPKISEETLKTVLELSKTNDSSAKCTKSNTKSHLFCLAISRPILLTPSCR